MKGWRVKLLSLFKRRAPRHMMTPSYVHVVTAHQFGDAWPFTVDGGRLTVKPDGSVLFTTRGKIYALNGQAIGQAAAHNWLTEIEPIRLRDPGWPDNFRQISPLIEYALVRSGRRKPT